MKTLLIFIAIFIANISFAAQQVISVNNNNIYGLSSGDEIAINVYHSIYGSGNGLTGLSLSMYYDQSKLELLEVNNILLKNKIINNVVVKEDKVNKDSDSSTTNYFSIAWLDFNKNWLDGNETLLYKAMFRVKSNFKQSFIKFSGEVTTDYQLVANPVSLQGQ